MLPFSRHFVLVLWTALLAAGCSSPAVGPIATSGEAGPTGSPGDAVNGCHPFATPSDFASGSTITFAYPHFTPQCLVVSPGATVTFDGTASGGFYKHPLHAGPAPELPATPVALASTTPIAETLTGTTATFTFPQPGVYAYYCESHHGAGMYGAILVK